MYIFGHVRAILFVENSIQSARNNQEIIYSHLFIGKNSKRKNVRYDGILAILKITSDSVQQPRTSRQSGKITKINRVSEQNNRRRFTETTITRSKIGCVGKKDVNNGNLIIGDEAQFKNNKK